MSTPSLRCTAFSGPFRIASGELRHVAMKAKQAWDNGPPRPIHVFDDANGRLVELPLELPAGDFLRHVTQPALPAGPAPQEVRKPGRPKLGVVAREVTLLPRHWDWLGRQPGGASVALRRLVDDARRVHADRDTVRAAREAAYRFMTAIAGDLPGFEEATRALFAGERERFDALVAPWPEDVTAHLRKLSAAGWSAA